MQTLLLCLVSAVCFRFLSFRGPFRRPRCFLLASAAGIVLLMSLLLLLLLLLLFLLMVCVSAMEPGAPARRVGIVD